MNFILQIVSVICTLILVFYSLTKEKKYLYYLMIFKPVLDITVNQYFFGFNGLQLVGIYLFVFLVFKSLKRGIRTLFNSKLILFLLLLQFIVILINYQIYGGELVNKLETFIKISTGYLVYFYAFYFMRDPEERRKLYKAIWFTINLLSSLFLFVYSLGFSTTDVSKDVVRYGGLYNDPGTPSYQAVIALVFATLYLNLSKKRNIKISFMERINFLLSYLLLLAVFSFTITKSAMLMLVVFLIMWFGFYKRRTIIIVPLIILTSIYLYKSNEEINTRFSDEVTMFSDDDANIESVGTGRVGRWINLMDMYLNEFSGFEKLFGRAKAFNAHNQYLAFLMQIGIIGVFLFLIIISRFLKKFIIIYAKTKNVEIYNSLILLVMFLLLGVTGHPFYWTTILWYLMIMLSLINVYKCNYDF